MARVTLQEYLDEARERISAGAYEEAIAICRHILERYPKHIKTYQILGEACLEKGDFEEATDIFKRLLEHADPENFVAHAGLGILSEEKGQIAEAIWYIERAFEMASNNEEVRSALRGLYGKRDGTEPTRIKLNKAALARLYARGGQYRQAIEGFRGLLELEPDRLDLKVALAETLWRDGRREQAAETAREILQTSPDCLRAILLLGMIQIEKGRDDTGWAILANARSLDPENEAAQDLFGERSPLPPQTVKIPRIKKVLEAEAVPTELTEPAMPSAEEETAPAIAPEAEAGPEGELEVAAVPAGAVEPAIPSVEEGIAAVAVPEEEAIPEEELEAEEVPTEVAEPAIPSAEQEAELVAAPEEEAIPVEELEAEAVSAEVTEPALPSVEEEAVPAGAPEEEVSAEEVTLASAAAITPAPLSDVERYKLHLEQRPKNDEIRLALARAYRDQEQMKLALEQYGILKRAKSKLLSEAISDMETIVASRPDNLEAHELLADLYVKNGQLQRAVDRYRWVLQRLDERSA